MRIIDLLRENALPGRYYTRWPPIVYSGDAPVEWMYLEIRRAFADLYADIAEKPAVLILFRPPKVTA